MTEIQQGDIKIQRSKQKILGGGQEGIEEKKRLEGSKRGYKFWTWRQCHWPCS